MIERISAHEERLTASARDVEDDFSPVENGIVDLLVAAKKRIIDKIGGQHPPLGE